MNWRIKYLNHPKYIKNITRIDNRCWLNSWVKRFMFNFIKYKFFGRRTLKEIEKTSSFRLMMSISVSSKALAYVFQNHVMKLTNIRQGHQLVDKLANLFGKIDIQTIAMIYTYFLWIYVYDWGKTLKNGDDKLRQLRVEYGLNNFNLVERNGYYTLAPIDWAKYQEYLKSNN